MFRINKILLILVVCLVCVVWCLWQYTGKLKEERNRYKQNNNALLSDITRLQVDSATMALDMKAMTLSLEEYKGYRAEDAALIKQMGIKLKNLESVAKHVIEVNALYSSPVKDTVVIRDTIAVKLQTIKVNTPYLYVDGVIENNEINGQIKLPVTLQQAISLEYKHKFLWWQWKVKAIHQTVSSDNPHVEIKYSELILIK